MTFHTPMAPPRLVASGGPVLGAIRALLHEFDGRPTCGPVTDAIRTMRAAVPAFDADPDMRALRRAISARIEADLATLDMLGGDPDLEPSLGASEPYSVGPAHDWAYGFGDDREADAGDEPEVENEHGGDIQDEPHDEDTDLEPSLCGLTVAHPSYGGDDREDGDDNGIADEGGRMEQFGHVWFGSAEDLDSCSGEPLCLVLGKLVAERWA